MKFQTWVKEQGGPNELAVKLGTSPQRVTHWLNRVATPRPPMLVRLVVMSRGKLTYSEIIKSTSKK